MTAARREPAAVTAPHLGLPADDPSGTLIAARRLFVPGGLNLQSK